MIDRKIYDFPPIAISSQLFHVPGAAIEGGFTSGGSRIVSPEPGGFAVLEMRPALSVGEWDNPWSSWVMSKTNGQVFRIPLVKTPQLIGSAAIVTPETDAYPRDDDQWHATRDNNDLRTVFYSASLEGSNIAYIDMRPLGRILKPGHVFGHAEYTYLVDEITYDTAGRATVVTTPPLRYRIAAGETCKFRPTMLGSIANPSDIRAVYEAANVGNIQLEKIIFNEVVITP